LISFTVRLSLHHMSILLRILYASLFGSWMCAIFSVEY